MAHGIKGDTASGQVSQRAYGVSRKWIAALIAFHAVHCSGQLLVDPSFRKDAQGHFAVESGVGMHSR